MGEAETRVLFGMLFANQAQIMGALALLLHEMGFDDEAEMLTRGSNEANEFCRELESKPT